jgi:hypothetical protein
VPIRRRRLHLATGPIFAIARECWIPLGVLRNLMVEQNNGGGVESNPRIIPIALAGLLLVGIIGIAAPIWRLDRRCRPDPSRR